MNTFVRSIAITASLLGILAFAPGSAAAASHGGGGMSGGGHSGGGWHGGGGGAWHGGGWHGGHGYWGHGGYWPYWGVGVGIGLGVGYWGGYPYYGGYYPAYPYYGGYYDAPPVVAGADPTYSTIEPANGTRSGQAVPQAGHAPDPIYYPKNGQSAATTESDRRECNRWATTQSGAMNDASIFQRATFACMEGRGYVIR